MRTMTISTRVSSQILRKYVYHTVFKNIGHILKSQHVTSVITSVCVLTGLCFGLSVRAYKNQNEILTKFRFISTGDLRRFVYSREVI